MTKNSEALVGGQSRLRAQTAENGLCPPTGATGWAPSAIPGPGGQGGEVRQRVASDAPEPSRESLRAKSSEGVSAAMRFSL